MMNSACLMLVWRQGCAVKREETEKERYHQKKIQKCELVAPQARVVLLLGRIPPVAAAGDSWNLLGPVQLCLLVVLLILQLLLGVYTTRDYI
jgi:hypothetical protein